jgi:hypothetical protein
MTFFTEIEKNPKFPVEAQKNPSSQSNLEQIEQNWSQGLWCTSLTPALVKLRQEIGELQASLGNIARPCLRKNQNRHGGEA